MRSLILLLTAGVALGVTGCTKDKVVAANCRADDDCQAGSLCENYECVPREAKACDIVLEGNPILQPSPHTVDFGTVDAQAALLQTVTLHNIGNCTLTLFEATLADTGAGFTCDLCDTTFPKEVWPGRSLEIQLSYTPSAVRNSVTELTLLSDDKEYPTLRIPIKANYIGTSQLVASPSPVDFGYTAQGRLTRRTVQLSNQGTGSAPVTINSVALSPADTMDFALVPLTSLPRTLAPASIDRTAVQTLEVRYTPRTLADHTADLVVTTNKGTFTVPLSGTSSSAPGVTVTPAMIDLGDVTLGTSTFRTITVVNGGGAPLTVRPTWSGMMFTTDFSTNPQIVPDVLPSQYVEVQVLVTATREGVLQSILNLETNDPLRPTVSIPVTARGVLGGGAEVVKLEMTFDNGADNAFDNDVRNVDMTLEHPFGYVCNKQTPNPMNWGNHGSASWLAFAPKEEPERIILADSRQDGTYRVMVSYQNDCASLPTDLLAGILGISVEVLVGYLSGGAIPVPGQDIGNLIQSICLDKSSSAVTVKVFVNGNLISEKNATLGRKGDSTYVLDLVRQNSMFRVP
ncbi:MAG: choice-of-anchor D domain-containing protein [Archangium sp.]|nr:choice-of-anchor D domain-containing protein [Archangium sp.]MDP3572834.1 choice-of-anchor D domain-containing protein [Archangium sp.]